MTNLKHKVVTRGARTATKIGGFVFKGVHKTYRHRINQQVKYLLVDPEYDVDFNPSSAERWTDWYTI